MRTPEGKYRKRAKRYNVPAHSHFLTFSCHQRLPLLGREALCLPLARAIRRACAKYDFAIWAYVFMPDHAHLLVRPRLHEYDISAFLKGTKLSASKAFVYWLRSHDARLLARLCVQERPGKSCYRVWEAAGGHDRNIRTREEAVVKAKYCHSNPVRRGLVEHPKDWRWCSYRWLEMDGRDDEPLIVDPWDSTMLDEPDDPRER